MRKFLLSSCVMLLSNTGFGQDFSNKGKEFWLAYSYHVGMVNTGAAPAMTVYLTSDVTTTYNVAIFGVTNIQSGTINANQVIPVVIPNTYFIDGNGIFNGRTVHVTAANPIVAYAFITRNQASAASLCLPTNVLGREYFAASFTQISNEPNASSFITIIAVEDNTTVEIVPTAATRAGWAAGSVNTVLLNKGQIYQVLGTTSGNLGVDLSGTSVRSIASAAGGCKKIAVFSGSGKLALGCANGAADNLYQQMYPVNSWGRKFLTVGSFGKQNNYFRIMRSTSAANVTLNGVLIPAGLFTNNYYQFLDSLPNRIESDQPISVTQYFTSQNCLTNSSPFDPDMIVLNPVEQNIDRVTLVSSPLTVTSAQEHHLQVIMKNTGAAISSFKFDGITVPAASWNTHPRDPGFSYLYLSYVSQGNHSLASDSGFNALAYGYGNAETYGYSAGANVKDLYQQISVQSQYGIEKIPSVCTGSPFKFKVSLPYCIDSVLWNLSAIPGPIVPTNPMMRYSSCTPGAGGPDSTTVVNGKTIYWYSLPTLYTVGTVGLFPVTMTTYTTTLSSCGSEQYVNFDLEVSDPPKADFTWTPGNCAAEVFQFKETTSQTPKTTYSFWWDFGDPASGTNNISTSRNPAHLFSAPGTYKVRFADITTPGCLSDTIEHTVLVPVLPTATISGATAVCLNTPNPSITFTATGGVAPYTFTYNINGGVNQTIGTTTGNSVTVSVPTTTAGIFKYNLVSVKNTVGTLCTQPQAGSASVEINPLPTATVAGSITTCQNATQPAVTFTGSAGTAPYTFTYNVNGGATQTVTTVTGNSVNVLAATNAVGTFVYNLLTVKDASSSTCVQAQTGSSTVIVRGLPTATIAGSTSVCLNTASQTITFAGAGGTAPYTFSYNINGGATLTATTVTGNSATVSVPTTVAGTFTYNLLSVKESGPGTCSQPQAGVATVTVRPTPTPGFTNNSPVCETRLINFTDNSIANAGTITNWAWNFGDPVSGAANISTLQNPTHVFSSAGNYTVGLTVTITNGCSNVVPFTKLISVSPRPLAGYVIPEVCLSDTYAQFLDSTKVSSGSIAGWSWNFGDANATVANPNTSMLQNPKHSYTAVGNYNVELIATSNNGCKDTVQQLLTVNGSFPVANFTVINPATLCANDSVAIVNTSTVFPGNITKVEIYWDNANAPSVFQTDDLPATGKVYRHLYPNFQSPLSKTFSIRFRAFSGDICVNDKISSITVNAAPKVQFNAMPAVCFDAAPFQITQASEIGAVPGSYTFSGPGVSPAGIFSPANAGVGTFNIRYIFTSSTGGCIDTATASITVLDTASARFSFVSPACQGIAASFTETSVAPPGVTLTNTTWNFGDGSPAEMHVPGSTFTHLFPSWGNYLVTMYASSSLGCKSTTVTRQVFISPTPIPGFSFGETSVCLPKAAVSFIESSTIPDGTNNALTYAWDFGDAASGALNKSTAKNPTAHLFTGVGPFTVTLTVKSGAGCVDTLSKKVDFIHPQPRSLFDFSKPTICLGDNISFLDQSDGLDGTIQKWVWDFGDGGSDAVQNPTHLYTAAGTYNVRLYSVNSQGCNSDTLTKPFTVNGYPLVDAGPDRVVLENGSIKLQSVVTGNNLSYLWTPNTFLNNATLANPTAINVTADVTYKLTATGRGGCESSDEMFLKVLKAPAIPNTFSPNGDGINEQWIIQYLNTYPDNRVQVFTRTGKLVFESRGYTTPWNGRFNGQSLPVDTYYYIIEPGSGRKPLTGYVTILK